MMRLWAWSRRSWRLSWADKRRRSRSSAARTVGKRSRRTLAVAETSRLELAAADHLEQCQVVGVADAKRAEAASSVDHGTGNRIEEAGARRDVLDHGQGIEVGCISAMDMGARVHAAAGTAWT